MYVKHYIYLIIKIYNKLKFTFDNLYTSYYNFNNYQSYLPCKFNNKSNI